MCIVYLYFICKIKFIFLTNLIHGNLKSLKERGKKINFYGHVHKGEGRTPVRKLKSSKVGVFG